MKQVIIQPAQGELVEKKSRFICDLFPIYHEEEIDAYIQMVKKKHYNARHHCYAYLFQDKKKAYDDGEPGGSAGMPILQVLEKSGYQYILAIVTRYFGGTLLGVGGLTRAYSGAVIEALRKARGLELKLGWVYRCRIEYSFLGGLEHWVDQTEGIYRLSVTYDEKVSYEIMVEKTKMENVSSFLERIDYHQGELEAFVIDQNQVIKMPQWTI